MILFNKGHSDATQGILNICTCEMTSQKAVLTGFLKYETLPQEEWRQRNQWKFIRNFNNWASEEGKSNSVVPSWVAVPYFAALHATQAKAFPFAQNNLDDSFHWETKSSGFWAENKRTTCLQKYLENTRCLNRRCHKQGPCLLGEAVFRQLITDVFWMAEVPLFVKCLLYFL